MSTIPGEKPIDRGSLLPPSSGGETTLSSTQLPSAPVTPGQKIAAGNPPSWYALAKESFRRVPHVVSGVFLTVVGLALAPICVPAAITFFATSAGPEGKKMKAELKAFNKAVKKAHEEQKGDFNRWDGNAKGVVQNVITPLQKKLTELKKLLEVPQEKQGAEFEKAVLKIRIDDITARLDKAKDVGDAGSVNDVFKLGTVSQQLRYEVGGEVKTWDWDTAVKAARKEFMGKSEQRIGALHSIGRVCGAPFISAIGHFERAFGSWSAE